MGGALAGAARRPVAVLMLVAATVVFGALSYSRLDVALLPDLNYPPITVRTEYPGAGPRDVDERVTERLEERLATTGGLVSMTSVSRSGFSDITLEFRWDADMTVVRSDLDAKIAAATLPDAADRPLVLPYDPNLDPIMRLAVYARGKTDADLALARRVAEEDIEKELKKLPGVAAAKIRGGREREIAVYLDENALRRTGIRLREVADALDSANRNEAAGLISEGPIEYIVRSVNELRDVREIENLVVKQINDRPVRIRQIGRVEETFKEREIAAYLDGKEAVIVEVFKKGDANLVGVAETVRTRVFGDADSIDLSKPKERGGRRRWRGGSGVALEGNLQTALESFVSIRLLTDQSTFIEGAINEVRDTAVIGGILAVLVLYLFLRRALVTFIAGSVIGICVVATFAPMFLAGVSLNIMSLGGLALGVGMLVDNAIVVLESAARRRESGSDPFEAAVLGVRDVAGAITASTLTSVCVFFPIVFVEEAGVAGQIFRDLALTVVFSLFASLLVALFVIPTCLATLPNLGPAAGAAGRTRRFGIAGRVLGERHVLAFAALRRRGPVGRLLGVLWWILKTPFALTGRLIALLVWVTSVLVGAVAWIGSQIARLLLVPIASGFQRAYRGIEIAYVPFLRRCLRARGIVVALSLGALAFAGWRATTLSPDLIPESLTGEFDVQIAFPPGTPLEQTAARIRPAEERVRALEAVRWTALTVGVEADADRAADEGEHTAQMTVHLADSSLGAEHERAVRREVEAILRGMPGAQPPEILPSTLFRFALPLKLVFFGGGGEMDLARIAKAADATAREVRDFPGVGSVRVGHGRGAREVRLKFDRDALFRFGVTAEDVATRIQAKIDGRIPTSLVEGSERTDIRVRIAEEDRASVRDLLELDVANPGERTLPLRMVLVGPPIVAEGPGEVRRVGGRHAATVEADYEGLQLDRVSLEAAAVAQPIAAQFGVDVEVLGRSQQAEQSNRALLVALLLAVFLVYAVMAAQFESLVQPVLIMVSLPLAGVGAVLLLDLLDMPLSVVVMLGSILLVGIAVNNAIVLVDRMNQQLARAIPRHDAIIEAARERLRPILMTTLTTVLGLIPLTGALAGLPGPLSLGGGEGAELRAPMAWTVIGGLLTSTILTLVVVPVLYDLAGGRRRPTA